MAREIYCAECEREIPDDTCYEYGGEGRYVCRKCFEKKYIREGHGFCDRCGERIHGRGFVGSDMEILCPSCCDDYYFRWVDEI